MNTHADFTKKPVNESALQRPRILSLCSGYGGLELGIERVLGPLLPVAYVEIEAFAIANLVAQMEAGRLVPAPVWTDIKTFDSRSLKGKVDLVTGGYPCQPFSSAGKRAGENDPRHLWPEFARILADARPEWCFFENVEGHVSLGLATVLADLQELGYSVAAGLFSAAEVGAPHQRKRIFILGRLENTERQRTPEELAESKPIGFDQAGLLGTQMFSDPFSRCGDSGCQPTRWAAGPNIAGCCECPELADSESERPRETGGDRCQQSAQRIARSGDEFSIPESFRCDPGGLPRRTDQKIPVSGFGYPWPAGPGQPQHDWEPPRRIRTAATAWEKFLVAPGGQVSHAAHAIKPRLGGVPHGVANRVDRLRLLGNGVVPATAAKAFATLLERIRGN